MIPVGEETGKKGAGGAPRFDAGCSEIDLDVDADAGSPWSGRSRRWNSPCETVSGGADHAPDRSARQVEGAPRRERAASRDHARLAIANRRKQLAQCIWLRARRAEAHLEARREPHHPGRFQRWSGARRIREALRALGRRNRDWCRGERHGAFRSPLQRSPRGSAALVPCPPRRDSGNPDAQAMAVGAAGLHHGVSGSAREAGRPGGSGIRSTTRIVMAMEALREALLTASDHFPVTLDLASLRVRLGAGYRVKVVA